MSVTISIETTGGSVDISEEIDLSADTGDSKLNAKLKSLEEKLIKADLEDGVWSKRESSLVLSVLKETGNYRKLLRATNNAFDPNAVKLAGEQYRIRVVETVAGGNDNIQESPFLELGVWRRTEALDDFHASAGGGFHGRYGAKMLGVPPELALLSSDLGLPVHPVVMARLDYSFRFFRQGESLSVGPVAMGLWHFSTPSRYHFNSVEPLKYLSDADDPESPLIEAPDASTLRQPIVITGDEGEALLSMEFQTLATVGAGAQINYGLYRVHGNQPWSAHFGFSLVPSTTFVRVSETWVPVANDIYRPERNPFDPGTTVAPPSEVPYIRTGDPFTNNEVRNIFTMLVPVTARFQTPIGRGSALTGSATGLFNFSGRGATAGLTLNIGVAPYTQRPGKNQDLVAATRLVYDLQDRGTVWPRDPQEETPYAYSEGWAKLRLHPEADKVPADSRSASLTRQYTGDSFTLTLPGSDDFSGPDAWKAMQGPYDIVVSEYTPGAVGDPTDEGFYSPIGLSTTGHPADEPFTFYAFPQYQVGDKFQIEVTDAVGNKAVFDVTIVGSEEKADSDIDGFPPLPQEIVMLEEGQAVIRGLMRDPVFLNTNAMSGPFADQEWTIKRYPWSQVAAKDDDENPGFKLYEVSGDPDMDETYDPSSGPYTFTPDRIGDAHGSVAYQPDTDTAGTPALNDPQYLFVITTPDGETQYVEYGVLPNSETGSRQDDNNTLKADNEVTWKVPMNQWSTDKDIIVAGEDDPIFFEEGNFDTNEWIIEAQAIDSTGAFVAGSTRIALDNYDPTTGDKLNVRAAMEAAGHPLEVGDHYLVSIQMKDDVANHIQLVDLKIVAQDSVDRTSQNAPVLEPVTQSMPTKKRGEGKVIAHIIDPIEIPKGELTTGPWNITVQPYEKSEFDKDNPTALSGSPVKLGEHDPATTDPYDAKAALAAHLGRPLKAGDHFQLVIESPDGKQVVEVKVVDDASLRIANNAAKAAQFLIPHLLIGTPISQPGEPERYAVTLRGTEQNDVPVWRFNATEGDEKVPVWAQLDDGEVVKIDVPHVDSTDKEQRYVLPKDVLQGWKPMDVHKARYWKEDPTAGGTQPASSVVPAQEVELLALPGTAVFELTPRGQKEKEGTTRHATKGPERVSDAQLVTLLSVENADGFRSPILRDDRITVTMLRDTDFYTSRSRDQIGDQLQGTAEQILGSEAFDAGLVYEASFCSTSSGRLIANGTETKDSVYGKKFCPDSSHPDGQMQGQFDEIFKYDDAYVVIERKDPLTGDYVKIGEFWFNGPGNWFDQPQSEWPDGYSPPGLPGDPGSRPAPPAPRRQTPTKAPEETPPDDPENPPI